MVPFVESCPLFRLALAMFPLLFWLLLLLPPLAEPLLLLLLLLHSVSACLSTAAAIGVVPAELGVTGADTKSKKSPLLISSGRNAASPMSMAVTGDAATTTTLVAEDATAVPALDDITRFPQHAIHTQAKGWWGR